MSVVEYWDGGATPVVVQGGERQLFIHCAGDLKAFRKEMRRHGARIAKDRLRDVIAADRAAVPCGRWVERSHVSPAVTVSYARRGMCSAYVVATIAQALRKPRYRYEARR